MRKRADERQRPPADVASAQAVCTVHEGLRKLVQLFPQVTRGLRRRAAPVDLHDAVLGPRHSAVASLLRDNGPLTIGRLADEVGITLATMSGLVAELERAGFVRRATDPSDRRRTIVALVPGRDAVIEKWLDGVTAPMVRALGKLSPEERATFVKAMEFLEAELNRGPAERRRLEQPSSVGNSTAGGSPRSLVEEPAL